MADDITPYAIRDARADEMPAIRELTLRAYAEFAHIMTETAWEGLSGAIQVGLAATEGERIIAVHNDTLLGSVLLFPPTVDAYAGQVAHAGIYEIRLLAVAPEVRGQGVGEALVQECIRRARARDATVLGLHTSISLQAAIRLYERLGFVRFPEDDFQPPGAERVEAYRLSLHDTGA